MKRPPAAHPALRGLLLGAALLASGAHAAAPAPARMMEAGGTRAAPVTVRNGREIYARFREGLADPSCGPETSPRWQQHFANAPRRLAARDSDVLPLFAYVVDALRAAHLPTEYALIPFVESGYKPGARSNAGPAGLWQFIALTARNHNVAIRPGYDGRLSPIDSTQAAVRYLKTLHGMFAGDWRLAVMAFNAGEYRVLGALKRGGQRASNAEPAQLPGLSEITQAYVRKLHALSCVLDQADDREEWLRALDRPVTVLAPAAVPKGVASLDALAARQRVDADTLKRLNPAFADGRIADGSAAAPVLAPVAANLPAAAVIAATDADAAAGDAGMPAPAPSASVDAATPPAPKPASSSSIAPPPAAAAQPRAHTVVAGDSIWTVARRYGLQRNELLTRNGLTAHSVLRPGMVLKID